MSYGKSTVASITSSATKSHLPALSLVSELSWSTVSFHEDLSEIQPSIDSLLIVRFCWNRVKFNDCGGKRYKAQVNLKYWSTLCSGKCRLAFVGKAKAVASVSSDREQQQQQQPSPSKSQPCVWGTRRL